ATQVVETKRFNGVELNVNEGDVKIAQDDLKKFAAGLSAYQQQGLPVGFACLSPAEVGPGSHIRGVAAQCWQNARKTAAGGGRGESFGGVRKGPRLQPALAPCV